MRSKTVVRSLISGHTTVVAHDDGSINLRVHGHRERRVTIASVPSVLLTMPNRQVRMFFWSAMLMAGST